ncbi:hypothetical protein EDEG_02399 [Edhazardia aedis USNM 41457]|uniref:Uncharacterized protein n=1 Tax=Edhazardia aedis (strain USNM 41457) TaxID=1003232 RepID=J9D619_EDHAE|nr:hypothetical protein EDEG_02399 [Edhazardia aedis USNM 41457]|eukprot:EJW03231.1 hypothetical protein EDEG_02399 [Edhazardia aedis USNM 41457]
MEELYETTLNFFLSLCRKNYTLEYSKFIKLYKKLGAQIFEEPFISAKNVNFQTMKTGKDESCFFKPTVNLFLIQTVKTTFHEKEHQKTDETLCDTRKQTFIRGFKDFLAIKNTEILSCLQRMETMNLDDIFEEIDKFLGRKLSMKRNLKKYISKLTNKQDLTEVHHFFFGILNIFSNCVLKKMFNFVVEVIFDEFSVFSDGKESILKKYIRRYFVLLNSNRCGFLIKTFLDAYIIKITLFLSDSSCYNEKAFELLEKQMNMNKNIFDERSCIHINNKLRSMMVCFREKIIDYVLYSFIFGKETKFLFDLMIIIDSEEVFLMQLENFIISKIHDIIYNNKISIINRNIENKACYSKKNNKHNQICFYDSLSLNDIEKSNKLQKKLENRNIKNQKIDTDWCKKQQIIMSPDDSFHEACKLVESYSSRLEKYHFPINLINKLSKIVAKECNDMKLKSVFLNEINRILKSKNKPLNQLFEYSLIFKKDIHLNKKMIEDLMLRLFEDDSNLISEKKFIEGLNQKSYSEYRSKGLRLVKDFQKKIIIYGQDSAQSKKTDLDIKISEIDINPKENKTNNIENPAYNKNLKFSQEKEFTVIVVNDSNEKCSENSFEELTRSLYSKSKICESKILSKQDWKIEPCQHILIPTLQSLSFLIRNTFNQENKNKF